jgi:heme/copper-type cytochrome/quinol oxidase subunit 2
MAETQKFETRLQTRKHRPRDCVEEPRALHHANQFFSPLAEPIFWIAAVLCIVAEVAILRAGFAPQKETSESAPMPHSPRGAEMIWSVIPAIVLALLLAATWRAIHS